MAHKPRFQPDDLVTLDGGTTLCWSGYPGSVLDGKAAMAWAGCEGLIVRYAPGTARALVYFAGRGHSWLDEDRLVALYHFHAYSHRHSDPGDMLSMGTYLGRFTVAI